MVEIKKFFYEDGQVMCEIPYVNGKKHGMEIHYSKSGKGRIKTPYKKGKQHGVAKYYDENGQIIGEIPYKKGKRHGVAKEYDKNGELKKLLIFENEELKETFSHIKENIFKREIA